MAANTFTNDQHKDLKADYIMANPPFNQKDGEVQMNLHRTADGMDMKYHLQAMQITDGY